MLGCALAFLAGGFLAFIGACWLFAPSVRLARSSALSGPLIRSIAAELDSHPNGAVLAVCNEGNDRITFRLLVAGESGKVAVASVPSESLISGGDRRAADVVRTLGAMSEAVRI